MCIETRNIDTIKGVISVKAGQFYDVNLIKPQYLQYFEVTDTKETVEKTIEVEETEVKDEEVTDIKDEFTEEELAELSEEELEELSE